MDGFRGHIMKHNTLLYLLFLATVLALTSCGKKDEAPAEEAPEEAAQTTQGATGGAEDGAATAPTPLEMDGEKYGNGVTVAEAMTVSELVARANEFDGQRVRVEGEVLEVCKKKGCWMNIAGDQPGSKLRIKVQDDVIVFPTTAEGKYAVVEGLVKKMPLSLDETRSYLAHEAEEQGREFDPASVTEAITVIRVDGLGAMIRDAK